MKRFVLALLLVGACGKQQAIVEAEAMADAICKCKDKDCAVKARNEGTARLMKYKDATGSEKELRQVSAALTRSQVCEQKLEAAASKGAGAPTSEPAAAGENK
jgi:major membrane immunogen (membrane-anchored lipoprotein)